MSTVNTHQFPHGDILVVDDTQSDLKLLSGILREAGYTVRPASDGELALRSVQAKLPDLILLDIQMPALDGYEICRRLKDSEDTRDIPVIFISVKTSPVDKAKAFGIGGVDYITKPFDPEEVLARVATHLALWRTQKEIREKNKQLQQEITERKRAEKRIEHLNQVLRAIRNVNQLIAREKGPDRLLKGTCDNLVQTRGYYNAWIALLDEKRNVVTTAESGLGKDFLPMADLLNAGTLTDCGQKALGQAEVVVTKDPRSTCTDCPLSDQYRGRGAMTVRLEYQGKLYGLLSASILRLFLEDQEERFLFQDIASDIAFALHDMELEEEHKRAEEALRESEEKYRSLVDSTEDSIYLVDEDCTYLFVNEKHLSRLSLPRDEVIGRGYGEFHSKEEAKEFAKKVKEVFVTDKSLSYEYGSERDGGYFIRSLSPLIGPDGRTTAVTVVSKDITERKQAEEALREARDYLEKLVNYANAPIIVWDPEFKITRFNHAFQHLTGYKDEEVIDKELSILFPEESRDESMSKIERTLQGEYWDSVEIPIVRKDGDIRIALWNSANIYAEDGTTLIATIAQGTDITTRKQAEENLTASLREKELLLQEIHHRVKNNMQVISSLLKLQAATIKDETLREPFRDSEHRVRAMALVHEKLYQAKDFTHIPFKDYLTSLIRYLYQSSTPKAGTIELVTEIEELPLTITHAIPCGLIVNELLSNALTHAFPGERTGTITIGLRSPEPHTYELTVSDDGIGLPETIDLKTTTSLGLHLVTILVEDQLKGEIMVERTGGTTFHIVFGVPE
jgi:PAS domain S-box-containing protein